MEEYLRFFESLLRFHVLKIKPCYFNDVISGLKTFEIRKNDRNFQVGDILVLAEYDDFKFTNRMIFVRVVYLTSFEQKEGFCVLGIQLTKKIRKLDFIISDEGSLYVEKII
ncbi:DUF3850 domain-containing protein [Enterococcus faecalis]|nr:DUF3850 domain-containing protein [Enterococcus faecalis]